MTCAKGGRCLARAPLLSAQVLCRLSFYVRWLLEHVFLKYDANVVIVLVIFGRSTSVQRDLTGFMYLGRYDAFLLLLLLLLFQVLLISVLILLW